MTGGCLDTQLSHFKMGPMYLNAPTVSGLSRKLYSLPGMGMEPAVIGIVTCSVAGDKIPSNNHLSVRWLAIRCLWQKYPECPLVTFYVYWKLWAGLSVYVGVKFPGRLCRSLRTTYMYHLRRIFVMADKPGQIFDHRWKQVYWRAALDNQYVEHAVVHF